MPLCFPCAMKLMILTPFPEGVELHQQKCITDLGGKAPKWESLQSFLRHFYQ